MTDSTVANTSREALGPAEEVVEVEGAVTDGPQASPVTNALTAWLFQPDSEARRVGLNDLRAIVSDDRNFVWVDLSDYTDPALHDVAAMLDLHRFAVQGARSHWQRPRLDVFKDHFCVTTTVARLDKEAYRVHAGQLDLFVGNNYLVSAHKLPLPFADHILTRAVQSPDLLRLDAAYMLYIVLDELLLYYEGLDEEVQNELEAIEHRALADTSDRFLEDLLRFKRYAFALSQLAGQHRDIFTALLRPDFRWVSGAEVEVYYRDLERRLLHLLDSLGAAKDGVNGAFDIYLSHLSHRTNSVIKVLTMVSAVLLPATLIIGLFSTSIQGLPLSAPINYAIMIAAILVMSIAILYIFHRKGWI